jgi:hypothetical protein
MSSNAKAAPASDAPVHIEPVDEVLAGAGPRGEPQGCPTGLSDDLSEQPPHDPLGLAPDTKDVHGKLEVEQLEGLLETGRDD